MTNISISVAMATYNGERFIKEQLDSILNQSMKVDEIIITDDCSKDKTTSIIKEYQQYFPQIHFIENQDNLGYKRNFKKALSCCHGDYIFLCDQDDIWDPNKVKEMISIMQDHKEILSLASSFRVIDQNDDVVAVESMPGRSNNNLLLKSVQSGDLIRMSLDDFVFHNYFQGCSICVKNAVKDMFVENFTDILPHDWILNIMASAQDGMYFYNAPLFSYRIHGKNTIGLPTNEKPTIKQKFHQIFNDDIRAAFAKERYESLMVIKQLYPEYFDQKGYQDLFTFYRDHVEYLKKGKPIRILLQNLSPYYKDLKPAKARVMDVVFCFLRKFKLV